MQYEKEVLFSESTDIKPIKERISDRKIRMLHSAMGLCTEAGEVMDQLKKHIFYGKDLDEKNLFEEIGDLFWYCAVMADTLGVSFERIQRANFDKLKARYGEKFSKDRALNRDLEKEDNALTGET